MRAGPAISTGDSHALLNGLFNFERISNEQRNHKLIVFGLPKKIPSKNCTETITRISSFLDVSVSSPEIARAFRS